MQEPQPRIMGVEKEIPRQEPVDAAFDTHKYLMRRREMYHAPIEGVVSSRPDVMKLSNNAFLSNGERLYYDIGNLEVASAECSGFGQLTEKIASIREFAARTIENHEAKIISELKPGADTPKIRTHWRVADHNGKPAGFHENYHIRRPEGVGPHEIAESITGFLIGRTIMNGSGIVRRVGNDRHEVVPAQKAWYITESCNRITTGKKPWIVDRNNGSKNHNGGDKDTMRLQIVGGDANISDAATRLTLGSTAVILRLLENDLIPDIVVNNVAEASRKASMDWDGSAQVSVKVDGKDVEMGIIDLLDAYLEPAQKHKDSGIFTPDEQEAIDDWEAFSEAYHADRFNLKRTLDWVNKQFLIEELGITDPVKMRAFDLQYDIQTGIEKDKRVGMKLRDKGYFSYVVPVDVVEHGIYNPPADTRASHRGELISALHRLPIPGANKKLDWGIVGLEYATEGSVTKLSTLVELSDPSGSLTDKAAAAKQHIIDLAS